MTSPRHATPDWDDEKDVESAMRSLDDMQATMVVDFPDVPDTVPATSTVRREDAPVATPVAAASVPPVISAPDVPLAPDATQQRVLRRKPTPRNSGKDDVRTLRRKAPQAPVQAPVASQPYDESSFTGPMPAPAKVTRRRSAASGPLLVCILLLRLLAIAFCCLVVLMAIPALGDRATLVQISSLATSLVPSSLSGVLVLPTPFGGAFRGDFALAAFLVYLADWALTNLRAGLAQRG